MAGKKQQAPQLSLDVFPVTESASSIQCPVSSIQHPVSTALVEYRPAGSSEDWRVNRFDLMAVELALKPEHLPQFHMEISRHLRGWMIVRRLFGICPVVPRMDSNADDLRTFTREELKEQLGLNNAQLSEELDRVRGAWLAVWRQIEAEAQAPAAAEAAKSESFTGQLSFEAHETLKKFGLHDVAGTDEQEWLAARVSDSATMLQHTRAGELVRMALLNELELRRISSRIAKTGRQMAAEESLDVRNKLQKEYDYLFKRRAELEGIYKQQLEAIDKIFPWMNLASSGMTARGVFSDAIAAHREFYRTKTNQIADGIFTASEIQILLRTSQQSPEPQYRAGQVVYLNMARNFLWDESWRGQFPPVALKKMDAAWKAAAMEISQQENEVLPDLMSDDPVKGEYPEVYLPAETP